MRFLGRFIRGLWTISRNSWVAVSEELRPRSASSGLYLFLFLVFAIVAIVLRLLGVDLDTADRWLDAQGGWLDALGSILFRLLCGLVLLCCAGVVLGGLWQMFGQRGKTRDKKEDRLGCLPMGIAAVIGYFAWFGVVN